MNVAHADRPYAPKMVKTPGLGSYPHHPNSPRMKFQVCLASRARPLFSPPEGRSTP